MIATTLARSRAAASPRNSPAGTLTAARGREAPPRRRGETARRPPPPPPAPGRPLADHPFDRALLRGAHDVETHLLPHRIATQHIEQLIEALETLAVDRYDDVAEQ